MILLASGMLTKEQEKWFNKTHKNNPNSRFYKKDWKDLSGKRHHLLDSYFNELARKKPPEGYITTKEFSKKYNFPIYEKIKRGPLPTKTESNFINSALMKTLPEASVAKGRKNLFLKEFLIKTLKPKQFETLLDLGEGKRAVKKVNYIRDDAELAKKVRTYIDSPSVAAQTRANMTKILKNENIKILFNKGDYKGLVKALSGVKGLTDAERANALLRISQAMSGVSFRDFEHSIKLNKISANKVFKGLENTHWGDPYASAYRELKRTTIKDALGDEYFTKSYKGFIDDARLALKNAGMDPKKLKLDLNEITGLTSAYKNKTFSSSQFINFMDSKFNQEQHADMIRAYGRHEAKLQSALKGKNPSEARQVIKDWETWRKDWFYGNEKKGKGGIPEKYRTKAVKNILPTFTLGKDPYAQVLSKKRLAELAGLDFNIREEGIKAGYGKTFKSIKTQPVLKEIATGDKKAIITLMRQLDGGTLAQFKKAYPKCFKQDVGSNALICLTKQAEKNPELFVKNSVSIGKATEGTTVGTKIANFLTKMKPFLRGTGWLALGEVVLAPAFALGPYARGKKPKRILSEVLYGLNVPKWLGGWAQSEYEEIKEYGGQEVADVWKMKQIDVKRDELFKDYTALMEYQTGKPQSIDSLQRSSILQEKLGQLSKEYSELSQQFLSGEVDAEGKPFGNELFDTSMDALTETIGQIQKADKQRVLESQQIGKKIGSTLMDKPREKFIDFTLGPNWKEDLPQYPSSTQYPHSPTTLGQHLSSDTNLPLFREGGIASLKKK